MYMYLHSHMYCTVPYSTVCTQSVEWFARSHQRDCIMSDSEGLALSPCISIYIYIYANVTQRCLLAEGQDLAALTSTGKQVLSDLSSTYQIALNKVHLTGVVYYVQSTDSRTHNSQFFYLSALVQAPSLPSQLYTVLFFSSKKCSAMWNRTLYHITQISLQLLLWLET